MILSYYKTNEKAYEPKYGTKNSACFDIFCSLDDFGVVTVYCKDNIEHKRSSENNSFWLYPGERALVPTNLIFNIPEGYSIRMHPRSGLSIKYGITLVNCEGVIDSDYIEPSFITIVNISDQIFTVSDGDRLCQGELVKDIKVEFNEITQRPTQKTDRNGGIGSTGV